MSLQRRAGAIRHRVAVGGGDLGIGRFAIELPRPAAGQDRPPGPDHVDVAVDQRQHADAACLHRVIRSIAKLFSEMRIVLEAAHLVDERLRQLLARRVAVGVEDARVAVPAFEAERQVVRVAGLLVEMRAPLQQFEHALGPFFDDDAHGLVIAEADADDFRVAHVRFDRIERLEHRRDAALGVPGVGLLDGVLGQQQDFRPALAPPRSPPAAPPRRRRSPAHPSPAAAGATP